MPRLHATRSALLSGALAAFLAAAGCGAGETAAGWAGTVDTLPGGGVMVRNPDRGAWAPGESWRLEEDLRLGAVDGDGPEQFSRPADIEVDGAGRLWILDGDAKELRVFTASGQHVRTVGRPGAGPGELGTAWSVSVAADGNVWVQDNGNRRYAIFDTAGAFVRTERMRGLAFGGGDVWGPDGRFYQRVTLPREGSRELAQIVVPHVLEADSLAPTDTLPLPGLTPAETFDVTLQVGNTLMRMRRPIPFTHPPRLTLSPDAAIWLTQGGGDYRILHLDTNRDTLKIVERAYTAVPVPDSAIDAAMTRLGPDGADVDLDRSRIPNVHPPFDSFHVDPAGYLWVRRHNGPATVGYDLFDPDGRYLGEPAASLDLSRFNLLEITDDALYGVIPGDLDVPYVVRLRIVRPDPA